MLATLFLLAVAERVLYRGDVMPDIQVAGISLGKQSEADAYRELSKVAARLETEPVSVRAGDVRLVFAPGEIGYDVDEAATVRAARGAGRSANPVAQTKSFVTRLFGTESVPLVVSWDERKLDALVERWRTQLADGVQEGDLRFEGASVSEVTPRAGRGIEPKEARRQVETALRSADRETIDLTIRRVQPTVRQEAVTRAARRARALLRTTKVITSNGASTTLAPEQLATALDAEPSGERLALRINPFLLAAALGDDFERLITPAVDARFAIDGENVSVVPGRNGQAPDLKVVSRAILAGRDRVDAPLRETVPLRTTEWAQSLGITHLVSSFTTHYPAGQARVQNIHRAADLIDGTIVEPGDTFSLNDTVGPRTEDRGFVTAPVYYQGFTEDVGGGVSQLATTTYNAVFYGAYENVTHKPHSVWFDRYPMVVEATVNYPTVDLKFRNNTSHGVLIETYYSSSSITVAFYGDNEGKTVTKEGPNILKETPPEDQFIDWPLLAFGETDRVEEGHTGYDVEVFQIIEQPGHETIRRRWFWSYDMTPNKILRGTAAPPTTAPTTTVPGAPTTTVPGATTTTPTTKP